VAGVGVTETEVAGFRALEVGNGVIAFTLVPELGAKIASLRDLRSGREWLWRNPRLPYRKVAHDASYVAVGDTGGWDECFPSVSPCAYPLEPWRGVAVPDHGELWSQTAQVETTQSATGGIGLRTMIAGVALPYTFARTLTLEPDTATLRLDYALRNTSGDNLAFIWSAHPLIPLEAGMRVALPAGTVMHLNDGGRGGDAPAGGTYPWPLRAGTLDLSTLPDPDAGISCKLWSEPLSEGWVELATRTGRLRFTFGPALLPQVGLWVNAGGWAGDGGAPYSNLGLEPCLGAQDSLAEAVTTYNRYGSLPPGGTRQWWIEVRVMTNDE